MSFLSLGGGLYLPRTLCFYSVKTQILFQGKASDACEQHILYCSFIASVFENGFVLER